MSTDRLFDLFNFGVLPAWALLVFAPRWKWTRCLVHSGGVPLALALAYVVALVLTLLFTHVPEGAGAHNLRAAMRLFDTPSLALVCWIHYLAFDLFVGAWMARDARRRGLPHIAVVPCLMLTLLYGPAGLLMYVALRAVIRRVGSFEGMSFEEGG